MLASGQDRITRFTQTQGLSPGWHQKRAAEDALDLSLGELVEGTTMILYHMRAKYRFKRPDNSEEWWQEAKDCTWYPTETEAPELVDDINDTVPPEGCKDEYNLFTDAPNRRVWRSRKRDGLLCLECTELPMETGETCEFLNGIRFMWTGCIKSI